MHTTNHAHPDCPRIVSARQCVARCVVFGVLAIAAGLLAAAARASQDSPPPKADQVTIQLLPAKPAPPPPPPPPAAPGFTARLSAAELRSLLTEQSDLLPPPLRVNAEREALSAALDRIDVGALVAELTPLLTTEFKGRFDGTADLISVPVPESQQVTLELGSQPGLRYRGPKTEVVGVLIHGLRDDEYVSVAVRFMQTARRMLDTGDPLYDRSAPDHLKLIAEREFAAMQEESLARVAARQRVAEALGLKYDAATGKAEGEPKWLKESRRFSYIIKDGKFVERLRPLVEGINREMKLAGFPPPSALDTPGITFDPDIKDVEVVLPKAMVKSFLEVADAIEQRMAEDFIISIEAVRLTDRDIVTGALAARLSAQVQGVHDIDRFASQNVVRELGLNALIAVANQQLQVSTLQNVASGAFPDGVSPVVIAQPSLPPARFDPRSTLIGSNFSVGADDIFFDGRQQSYGFSYVTPDGIEHRLGLDVVDSLRKFWDRIERNLIVHKIKKTETKTKFTVPVGPQTKTYDGIAALISQEDQQLIVATGTGAISQISATAGTWLVIDDFEITPIPGSSTTLTEEERDELGMKVLLTVLLRDPAVDVKFKQELLRTRTRDDLHDMMDEYYKHVSDRPIRDSRESKTYRMVFDERTRETGEDAAIEKKERNSAITLNFFSSQGNIVQQPGSTQLGSANDLTSFTTVLRPNMVTPISSFMTKSGSSAVGETALAGTAQGERTDQTKAMTHLVIRARFPTAEREKRDLTEGRHLGYFELPHGKDATSDVELPLLSSSEHPLERLAKLRVGLMFETLQADRIKRPATIFNPNRFPGSVPRETWEAATTRMLMCRKIIADSPHRDRAIARDCVARFIVAVRSLLEYDPDFFDAPNVALRNLTEWNNPDRIVVALSNTPGRFALNNLVEMLDEIGHEIVTDAYAEKYLARAEPEFLGPTRIFDLTPEELRSVRRDVAAHLMRIQEAYGDAFLEAISNLLELGSYRLDRETLVRHGPLKGMRRLVVFDLGGSNQAAPELVDSAHDEFVLLKRGGYRGKLFEPSLVGLEHMSKQHRRFAVKGDEVLRYADDWEVYAD
ncbi:MAG: hypothetical protein CHACPFDD_03576 [Phycisphaerae bacterium]|nr:hypothetical protein [Phycisphaerae bacterium]